MASHRPSGMESPALNGVPRLPARGGTARIRRFHGLTRRTSDWDGLHRDPQLWFGDGECLVHFFARGASRRGASLKVPIAAVEKLDCAYLREHCLYTRASLDSISSEDEPSDSGYGSERSNESEIQRQPYELYIPAPAHLSREQAFVYHLTTRNFLAFAVSRPVVGERLSTALIDLWTRLQEWQAMPIQQAFISYCEEQGYLTLSDNAEHALACLKLADKIRSRDMWVNSFCHCVGMHDRLDLSPEFEGLSRTTVALITRASMEMDLHIGRVIRTVGGFLEEELGSEHLGLSKSARDHLDHFRSCLHAFYVGKLGYFPPNDGSTFNKRIWADILHDFEMLYEYLVDTESTGDLTTNRGSTGGFCVLQNVKAFDQRYHFEPLPHPLPLLPEMPSARLKPATTQATFLSFKFGKSTPVPQPKPNPTQVLADATNRRETVVTRCALVQEYNRFERQKLEEKLDVVEARKVRWMLIYGVLQMLNSVIAAPVEVTGDTAPYPLCILTVAGPHWIRDGYSSDEEIGAPASLQEEVAAISAKRDSSEGRRSRISIHPDCEADNAEDYFASTQELFRSNSQFGLDDLTPQPLKIVTSFPRTASIRSSVHSSVYALSKSVVGSLNRRNSSRKDSLYPDLGRVPTLCEVLQEDPSIHPTVEADYGNAALDEQERRQNVSNPADLSSGQPFEFNFDLAAKKGEPTLDGGHVYVQSDEFTSAFDFERGMNFDSHDSYATLFPFNPAGSTRSSSSGVDDDSPVTDLSSWDGGSWRRGSDISASSSPVDMSDDSHPPTPLSYKRADFDPTPSAKNYNAGCYVPTGMITPPKSRFSMPPRALSSTTVLSIASSDYTQEIQQADDIEEEEMRGRQRSRALDRLARFGRVGEDAIAS